MAKDVVTGFLDGDNRARGRPVGAAIDKSVVLLDKSGALLIADDVGNTVWRGHVGGPIASFLKAATLRRAPAEASSAWAIANAVFYATGKGVPELPIRIEDIAGGLSEYSHHRGCA
jgi:hypothetical protein